MAEPNVSRKELLEEMMNRRNLGDKKFHSDTSLQQFGEDERANVQNTTEDPGVQNTTMTRPPSPEEIPSRRRTVSQPGPGSGGLITATAARAARRRPPRNVNYSDDLERSESERQLPRIIIPKDNSGTATPTGDRGSPFPSIYNGNIRNGDVKSLNSYRLYAQNGGTTPRKRSVATMDAQSIRSVETLAPPPTSPKDNKRLTTKYLTLVASSMYAILLVTLGIITYISDPFIEDTTISPIYSLILGILGFVFHIYLMVDINRYKTIALKNQKITSQYEEKLAEYFRRHEEEYGDNTPGDRTPEPYNRPTGMPPPVLMPLKHDYCFSQGRHSGSFYLKMGAAGFALGHLIHSILLITVQLNFLMDDDINNEDCVNYVQVALDIFSPIYCFLQLFFVFKYSNVIILRAQGLAHFAFMHMIGSSLCFWVSTIVRETILALTLYAQSIYGKNETEYSEINITTTPIETESVDQRFWDVGNLYDENCVGSAAVSSIFSSFSPYLYPFSVEFNILIVAVYFIIWSNIGHCHNEDSSTSETNNSLDDYSVCKIPTANEDNDFTSNIVIHADCHASNRGLFMGLIVMVIIAGMLIIGFVFSSVGEEFLDVGYLLNDVTKLGLHSIMLFAVILAFTQTTKLDINEHPVSLLDDILLFVCLPPFFMETVFSMVATITILNVVKSIDFVVMVMQVLIQTPLIMDALRRCSNTRKLRRSKPGRELIMFLIIANVGMWVFYTFSYKSPDSLDERYTFYGKVLWTVLGHVSLPLIMFYRFHSSVCFADIWDSAYKPGLEH